MANAESSDVHHWQNDRSTRQSHLRTRDHHFHLRRDGDAGRRSIVSDRGYVAPLVLVIRSEIRSEVRQRHAAMELLRFLPCLHVSTGVEGGEAMPVLCLGSYFVCCAENGSNRCGRAWSVPVGRAYLSFSSHS